MVGKILPIVIGSKVLQLGNISGTNNSTNSLNKISSKTPITGNPKLLAIAKTSIGFDSKASTLKNQMREKPENNNKSCADLRKEAEQKVMKEEVLPLKASLEQNQSNKQVDIPKPHVNQIEQVRQELANQKREIHRNNGRSLANFGKAA